MNLNSKNPWLWVPSLYFAEGLPYILVNIVSVLMYSDLGVSNKEVAFYTSMLSLPWVIKPLWSPFVDNIRTKRFWVVSMQLLMSLLIAGVVVSLPLSRFFIVSMIFLFAIAYASATHDIAADGFYMLGLTSHQQAFFVGIRNIFYRFAMIAGQSGLLILAGYMTGKTLSIGGGVFSIDATVAWAITFGIAALLYLLIGGWHYLFAMPYPVADSMRTHRSFADIIHDLGLTVVSFFRKQHIWMALAFFLLFRLGESQLAKISQLFLRQSRDLGGLGLSLEQIGTVSGGVGVGCLLLGGILGGFAISRWGLKRCLWPMVIALNVPDLLYVFLAVTQPDNMWLIAASVGIEQFGYGFGFTAYSLYMIYMADGAYKTSHFALFTGVMALGMMLPGMISGWVQEYLGYLHFFIWVLFCTIPGFLLIPFLKIDRNFGKKQRN
jgi:PAT family beta-lactamase induction signal transducer AmpG